MAVEIPYGKCQCGCGGDAPISTQNYHQRGILKGEPARYIRFHHRGRMNAGRDDITEFWKRVRKGDGCWEWTGTKKPGGYGNAYWGGKMEGAHRVSYKIHHGPIPDGLEVCHNCPEGDNPACVRPDHLFAGTRLQNMQDAAKKGRTTRKLSMSQITELRARRSAGETARALATAFGINQSTVFRWVKPHQRSLRRRCRP